MVKLKINNECILCGACTVVDGSEFEMNGKINPKGDYSESKAKEIIDICPVNAISKV